MRLSAVEKQEIINLVERSELPAKKVLEQLSIARSSFYDWYKICQERGLLGLEPSSGNQRRQWNQIPYQ